MKQIKLLYTILLIKILGIFYVQAQSTFYDVGYSIYNPSPTPPNTTSKDFIPASPQAASLGIFGQIPVGNYTGTAEISIPLYNINYKELSIPLSISYHTSGIKPDIFPGTVGLGWTLNAGGAITRVVHGSPDYGQYPLPGTFAAGFEDPRGNTDWASSPSLMSYIDYMSHLRRIKVLLEGKANPDEFFFNINGHTGSFFVDPTDTFHIQSIQGGTFKIVMQKGEMTGRFPLLAQTGHYNLETTGIIYNNEVTMKDMIQGFTMIDVYGTKYHFGGSFNSIEFSRPGFSELPPGTRFEYYINPMSWNLVAIESPNGYSIQLTYNQQTIVSRTRYNEGAFYQLQGGALTYCTLKTGRASKYKDKYTLINGCYLTEIEFPSGKIVFSNSMAYKQLDYPPSSSDPLDMSDHHHILYYYNDVVLANTEKIVTPMDSDPSTVRNRFFPYKLDEIKVFNKSGCQLRHIQFTYTERLDTRLKLTGLNIGEPDDKKQSYSFLYNPMELPPYLSEQTDHYGYYNGKKLFENIVTPASYVWNDPGYIDRMKTPDSQYTQAELLQKVIYPTKGYTLFGYEPHDYGCIYLNWPSSVSATGSNLSTGGVRIKSIRNYDIDHVLLTEREYHYVKDFHAGGSESSGVLAYKPQYVESYENKYQIEGNNNYRFAKFFYFTTNPVFPMTSSKGNHVTYSEVAIEEKGNGTNNGFTIYKYKNYDNGYPDKDPVNWATSIFADDLQGNRPVEFWKQEGGSSMSLERGQLVSEAIYGRDRQIKKKVEYAYNDDVNRFNEHVRYLHMASNSIDVADQLSSYRMIAGLHYTYFPFLKEKTITEYLDKEIISKQTYSYHHKYRLLESEHTHDSKGQTVNMQITYPFNYANNTILQKMTSDFMLDYPIEKTLTINGQSISKQVYEYSDNLCVSDPIRVLFNKMMIQYGEGPLITEVTYNKYDQAGNPLCATYKGDANTSYLWGYQGQYPIVKIENAKNGEQEYVCDNMIGPNSMSIVIKDRNIVEMPFDHEGGQVIVLVQFRSGSSYGNWNIFGPINKSGSICPASICSTPTTLDLPKGTYRLKAGIDKDAIFQVGTVVEIQVTYMGNILGDCRLEGSREFFYEGFEDEPHYHDLQPYAGQGCHALFYKVPFIKPDNIKKYLINYQAYTNGKWEPKVQEYTNNMILSGTAIDEVRVYPADALMTTYTYKPLVGMTSETDPSGRTVFYEYDDLGRLIQVKDEFGKIIKEFRYHYAQ